MLDKNDKRALVISGIKMHNAGVKRPKYIDRPIVSSDEKERVDYPTLYLNAKQAPALSGKEVGDTVTMLIKGKVISHSKNDRIGSEARENFDIEIRQLGCASK